MSSLRGRWRPGHTGAQPGDGLTAVRFDDAGLHAAVGTAGGRVALFDLRSPRPLLVKDHMYGAPIVDVKFHAPDREAGGARARRLPLRLGLGQGPPQCYEQTAPGCACAANAAARQCRRVGPRGLPMVDIAPGARGACLGVWQILRRRGPLAELRNLEGRRAEAVCAAQACRAARW